MLFFKKVSLVELKKHKESQDINDIINQINILKLEYKRLKNTTQIKAFFNKFNTLLDTIITLESDAINSPILTKNCQELYVFLQKFNLTLPLFKKSKKTVTFKIKSSTILKNYFN